MAEEVKKRSNYVGKDMTDMEKYLVDIDRDVFNLFEEKSINLVQSKRYSLMNSSSFSS